jgi:TonB family protein
MGDFENDIEKYRKGLLTEKEMHLLEKRAFSDPFLADALEGAESIGSDDFSMDVKNLKQQLLKKKRNWWPLGVAASFLLIVTVSYFVYRGDVTESNQRLSTIGPDSAKVKESPKRLDKVDTVQTGKQREKLLAIEKTTPKISSKNKPSPDTVPSIAAASNNRGIPQNLNFAEEVQIPQASPLSAEAKQETQQSEPLIELEAEKRKEVNADKAALNRAMLAKNTFAAAEKDTRTITGKVTSSEDGTPIPGVSILVPGTPIGNVTDIDGNFVVTIPTNVKQLLFSFIGFQPQQITLGNESRIDVAMTADVAQLSEVVVVGYGTRENEDDLAEKPIKMASPVGGRRAYNKYLEKNLKYPETALENKIEGKVTVQFIVDLKGDLADFAVIRSLGFGCDEEVIRLVKAGPKWNPTMQADIPLESTVRVKVKFKMPK